MRGNLFCVQRLRGEQLSKRIINVAGRWNEMLKRGLQGVEDVNWRVDV